jgi:hypothetical protein
MSEKENIVDKLIAAINNLSDTEKRELTIKVRTTTEGIKAYTSFLYGVTSSPREIPPKEDSHCEDTKNQELEGTSNTETPKDDSGGTKDSEEWL